LRENPGANNKKQASKKINKKAAPKIMNTPNPLLPQGSLPQRGKSSIYFKILMIVAIHTVLIGGILMVGCKDANKPQGNGASQDQTVLATPATPGPSADVAAPTGPATTPAPVVTPAPTLPVAGTPATVTIPAPVIPPVVPPTPGVAKEYVIASGDLLSTIAKKNGVSLKALEDANPGLDPKKLQIGKKLQIPAAPQTAGTTSSAPTGSSPSAADSAAASGDSTTYTVKTGDVLIRIARAHGTTVAAIQSLNDMKTTSLRPGQKLKLPVMKVASVGTVPVVPVAPTAPAATIPASTGGTAPATAPATTTY
jgi:LysM repeat protein